MKYYIVDAFTNHPFGGNTAGVVLLESDTFPTDNLMQAIAAELRDSLSLQLFDLHYGELSSDKAAAIRAAIPTSVYYSNINRFYKIASDDQQSHHN